MPSKDTSYSNNITGRDDLILAKALFVAARALKAQIHPPHSDIADMELLLRERFGGHLHHLELSNELGRALRLGFEPQQGPITVGEIREWILAHEPEDDENVIALFDDPRGQDAT